MKQVKIFEHYSYKYLQDYINEWLKDGVYHRIIDIKFSTTSTGNHNKNYLALIIYEP